jgi:hypothetical protein
MVEVPVFQRKCLNLLCFMLCFIHQEDVIVMQPVMNGQVCDDLLYVPHSIIERRCDTATEKDPLF